MVDKLHIHTQNRMKSFAIALSVGEGAVGQWEMVGMI
jgi:hypothetical protein